MPKCKFQDTKYVKAKSSKDPILKEKNMKNKER